MCVSTEWQWMGSGCEEYKMKKGPKVETSSTINVEAWGIRPECRFLPLYQIHQGIQTNLALETFEIYISLDIIILINHHILPRAGTLLT